MDGYRFLDVARDGSILTLTITNPPDNTLPSGFFKDLFDCCKLMEDPEIRAVVFTGRGRVFSKGADLEELRSGGSLMLKPEMVVDANKIFNLISGLHKPTVAAINGACFGGGLELALACHIRVCSEKAWLGLPEVSAGLIPGLGGIPRLVRVVGEAKAIEMILLGDMVNAEQARELGLVSRVFPKKDFMNHVYNFTKTLIATSSEAIEEALKLVIKNRVCSEDEVVEASAKVFCRLAAVKIAE